MPVNFLVIGFRVIVTGEFGLLRVKEIEENLLKVAIKFPPLQLYPFLKGESLFSRVDTG